MQMITTGIGWWRASEIGYRLIAFYQICTLVAALTIILHALIRARCCTLVIIGLSSLPSSACAFICARISNRILVVNPVTRIAGRSPKIGWSSLSNSHHCLLCVRHYSRSLSTMTSMLFHFFPEIIWQKDSNGYSQHAYWVKIQVPLS